MNKAVWLAPKRVGQHAGVRHPCEDDDSCFRQFLSYSQYDFVTAQFWQKKVNNHQMRRSLSKECSCRKSRTGLAHHFILRETFQIAAQQLTNSFLIVYQQDARFHRRHATSEVFRKKANYQ